VTQAVLPVLVQYGRRTAAAPAMFVSMTTEGRAQVCTNAHGVSIRRLYVSVVRNVS